MRLWPVYATSFLFRGRYSWRLRHGGYYGPSFLTAWTMTGAPGALLRFTLPILVTWTAALGAGIALAHVTRESRYAIAVGAGWMAIVAPLLHLVTAQTAAALRVHAGIEHAPASIRAGAGRPEDQT